LLLANVFYDLTKHANISLVKRALRLTNSLN